MLDKKSMLYISIITALILALVTTVWQNNSDYAWGVTETGEVLEVVCREGQTMDKDFDDKVRVAVRYARENDTTWPIDVTASNNVVIYCGGQP